MPLNCTLKNGDFYVYFITIKNTDDTKPASILLEHTITSHSDHARDGAEMKMTKGRRSRFLPVPPFLSSVPAASFHLKSTERDMSHRSDSDVVHSLSPPFLVP